ncbi:protein translocase subunit SecD [Streptomyces angustmyceticus]|uniref:Protein translocase subunit SecD n=1 Tax=Streptomyces angustmyceticus TaxID=285578 RepID=A0A5J4LQF2_9ACTN|nr:protein translocase subunit SecD [Streptomyces angustmyceticus]UAL70187.1 protein translocase subunit SecD [Streptomyces angustmyceticus]GES34301.1 protein translocase subunit SecD [Streptomyces angustmyceticus]
MAAPKKGRRAPASQGHPGRTLILVLIAMAGLIGGMFYSGTLTPRLGIDLAGGTSFTLAAQNQPGKPNAINETNMNTAAGIMERRVNGLGVTESEVQTQGSNHIIVNIPKGTDAKQARQQVGTTAQLGFRPVLTTTAGTKTPEPKPSPSKGGTNGKGKGDKATGDQAKNTPGTQQNASSSPSSKPTTQGRAVTDSLKKAPSAKPTPSGPAKPSTPPVPTPPGGADIPPALQKQLNALDCSSKKSRAAAGEKAANTKPSDPIVACKEDGSQKYVLGPVGVEGTDVSSAKAVFDSQQGQGWIVQMDFTSEGGKKFADVTGKLATKAQPQNQFAIVLDGAVVSDPRVSERLNGGNATISGGFTQQSAEDLGNMLSYGALPLSFKIDDETTVTAALGGEQLHAGLIAGAIGLALVVIYLVAYYRGLALVALASLGVSAVLTYTIMTLLGPAIGFALNLPAVCGAIVAIGITADSFIVYFERIRDEIREGRTLRPAVERGWPRARRTILVSDFVSFLAAAVLFIVTVGKVQGFAFTLGLTTVLDVVVVFLFTKPLMTLLARRKFFSEGHSWSGLDPKRLGAKPPLRRRRGAAPTTKEA